MALEENELTETAEKIEADEEEDAGGKDIYFIATKGFDHVKIGFCGPGRVFARMSALQAGSSLQLHLLGIIPNVSAFSERVLHAKFARHRMHREWFRLADEIRIFILLNCILPDPPSQTR